MDFWASRVLTGKQENRKTGNREQGTAKAKAKAGDLWEKGVEGCGGAEFVGVLRLRLAQSTRQTPLRMTAGTGNSKSKGKGGGFVGERGGGLGWYALRRGSFGFAQDRLFALERRAQDDSVKQATAKCGGPSTARRTIRPSAAPVGMTGSI